LSTRTLRARWVFPVSAPPIPDGVVTIDGERILAVEPAGARTVDLDLGDAAILPGLVNAHTHLDLTGMRGLAPPSPDFVGWLREVIAYRRARSPEQVQADIYAGIRECLRFGTTLLGDISGDGSSWNLLAAAPVRALVFREVLGLSTERVRQSWINMLRWVQNTHSTDTCRSGLGPHAPYSVNFALIRTIAWNGYPMTIHLAETAAELELLEQHSGPFLPFLQQLGVWEEGGLVHSIDWILWRTQRSQLVLFAHGNYLPPDARIPGQGTIVYCPRTHAAFGHPPHPFREFLARGVRVALGTDSLASNPDLDLLAEARFIACRYPDFPGDLLLRMATLSGAEALGWADETGSLTPGKSADLVVVPLSGDGESHHLLFESSAPVRAVLFRGRWMHDSRGELGPVFA
jgi:cytosine/adenosine deaminase-related metal-dependent hydrolase